MYVSQIDNIIDQVLNDLYLKELYVNKTVNHLVKDKVINFVEYFEQINANINSFMDSINKESIQKIINSKENVIHIIDIIKRYVAYYYFLYIGFHYTGTEKDYRNNIIQFSKLQEGSTYLIKNFFDTENNYQIVTFYKIIKDTTKIITMTELQKKSIDTIAMKDALSFIERLGETYVTNYFLIIDKKNKIEVNSHNLIKTIVFYDLYQFQERHVILNILNEIVENESETMYINIVVSSDISQDFDNLKKIFSDQDKSEIMARRLYDLINYPVQMIDLNANEKNSELISIYGITPIVDDFLRYHRDSYKTDLNEKIPIISSTNEKINMKTKQNTLKGNTNAQIILNKIDIIQSLYSENVINNQSIIGKIKQYFYEPLINRKIVLHNYIDELEILNRMKKTEAYKTNFDDNYIELLYTTLHPYVNFKDFKKYGMSINLDTKSTINLLRYSNIEYQSQYPTLDLDIRTGTTSTFVNLVGLTIGPLNGEQIRCSTKGKLIDIRKVNINYLKNNIIKKVTKNNGYKRFLKIMEYYFIDTIIVKKNKTLSHDYKKIKSLNPIILDKVIYWIYDMEIDTFKSTTYESTGPQMFFSNEKTTYNFQEKIKRMNVQIYDKINILLKNKLEQLINEQTTYSIIDIYNLIILFSTRYRLVLTQHEKSILIHNYLYVKKIDKNNIVDVTSLDKFHIVNIELVTFTPTFNIKIDLSDPIHPRPYQEFSITEQTTDHEISNNMCIHLLDWDEINNIQISGTNEEFKKAILQFITLYVVEAKNTEYTCKICGQNIEIQHFVQDCKYSNTAGRYVSSYTTSDIQLKNMIEYINYSNTITYLKKLIKRISLLTGTNMLVGTHNTTKQKQEGVIKQIIDLFIKHNSVNMIKNINMDEFAKKFGIDKKFSSILFFELDDYIFDTIMDGSVTQHSDSNKLKINNIILYFVLIFLSEINGTQIIMSNYEKYANIYFYYKYGEKLFSNLLIVRNISDNNTVPIINYPVLCYNIYLLAFYLSKYKIWMYTASETTKIINITVLKNIITTLVELFNSITMDYNTLSNDYAYSIFIDRFYAQLNNVFSDTDIINILKKKHIRFSDDVKKADIVKEEIIPIYYIDNPIKLEAIDYHFTVFKVSNGLAYDKKKALLYHNDPTLTDKTNCPTGAYHHWIIKNNNLVCTKCNQIYPDDMIHINRLTENYYYILKKMIKNLSTRLCYETLDDTNSLTKLVCANKDIEKYTKNDIDSFDNILEKNSDIENEKILTIQNEYIKITESTITEQFDIINKMHKDVIKQNNNIQYGIVTSIVDKFINMITKIVGEKVDLHVDKYPVYINDDVYIIDHYYDNKNILEPLIILQHEKKILFKENHPFFKTDVYYYMDSRSVPVDIFYDANTLQLLGYRQKHKEYVVHDLSTRYLKINKSIHNKLLLFGYTTKYTTVKLSDKTLDNLINNHIKLTRMNIDKISRLLSKIKNYHEPDSLPITQAGKIINDIINKYSKLFGEKIKYKNAFDKWIEIRSAFVYKNVDWSVTNIDKKSNIISSETLNYYDVTSGIMIYYLIDQLTIILDNNPEKNMKHDIVMMYIELINYIYSINNVDIINNNHEIKRFGYLMNASEGVVDLLKKGQSYESLIYKDDVLTDVNVVDSLDSEEAHDRLEEIDALDMEPTLEMDPDYETEPDQNDYE